MVFVREMRSANTHAHITHMLLARTHVEKAMQLDVADVQCALMVTDDIFEDAASLRDVEFLGMNEISQFVYKATWYPLGPSIATIPAPKNIYISIRYNPDIGGLDFYAQY